jgi:hypothetical protein
VDSIIAIATRALSEHGEGSAITTSHGAVLLPADASTATDAMRAVDLSMYENKNSSRVPADAQTMNALLHYAHRLDTATALNELQQAAGTQFGVSDASTPAVALNTPSRVRNGVETFTLTPARRRAAARPVAANSAVRSSM